ncbi:hypothetical protein E2562_004809 [Oryza meyeriana var. granulata]|uniref:Uncharacterized protein n=1 Tax=Oryza meyeriana var. granulata TaxID=110450 RepID=A0A6G1DGG6_9ORYZ|nr:hypothetical protein E2562_004809 [Oryza meyeriana var. granulata]
MAEIDTRPLESVRAALTHFQQRTDHQSRFSPDRNLQEIENLTKELASCKLQLEVKENEKLQANLKLDALQNATQELYDNRIAHLEADNRMITRQQSEAAEECKALRDELTVVRDELDAVKRSNAFLLRDIELMETRMILARENTRDALNHILQLNESVLSSAVAAIRAEEERSVFFQEITLEFFNSDKKREVINQHLEMIQSLESELMAKTVEIAYLQSQLQQVKEHCISTETVALPSEIIAGNQESQAVEAALGNGDVEDVIAGGGFVTVISKEDDGAEFYTKEIEHDQQAAAGIVDGYVLVAKSNADEDELKGKLDAAQAEIGDLRFNLEEAVRRAELAEEAKAALERALREEI